MNHVLATVLVSLTLPAVALVIIVGIERVGRKPEDEAQNPGGDPNVLPESPVSAPTETTTLDEPQARPFRERAG